MMEVVCEKRMEVEEREERVLIKSSDKKLENRRVGPQRGTLSGHRRRQLR